MSAFEVRILAKGEKVIEEGTPGAEAFVLARGELEVFRGQQGDPPLLLARLGNGVVFGEMALLSRSPRAASVVAARPCVVLIIRVEALDAVARKAPEVGTVIAGYCHRRMVANLVRTSSLLAALSAGERQALIERFAAKTFETGDKLISQGKESDGLHVVASGSVSVVRNDGGEDVVIAELGVGEVIGEVSLVFRRPSNADVVAAHPTMTLFLPRVRFRELVREHPTLLAQLYELASKRDDETASIVAEEASDATDLIILTRSGSPGETSPDRGGALGRVVRNAASMLAGDAAGEILVVYALGLAALSLGPVGFGRLAESQAFMDPFDILGGLGLGNVAMVVAASRGGVDGALQGTIWGMRTMSAVLTATLGLAAAFLTGRADSWRLLVAISVGMMLVPVSIVSILPFRYEQALHRRMVVPFLVSVVRLAGAYLAYRFMCEPLGFQLAVLGATAAAAALDYRWARRFYPERPHFDWGLARRLLAMGWPAAVFEVTVAIYSRASYFLLRGSGAVAQGEYAAADRLVKPLLSVATALYVSALPAIAALAAEGRVERLRVTYRQAVVRVFAFALPVALPFWFLAALLLRRFAPAYAGSIWPFRTLLVGAFFMFLNTLSAAFILALGRFRVIMVIVLVDLGVYLALAMHLIPKYGSLGAALSTTTMESFNACMQTPVVFFLLRASGQRQRQ